ncbi:TPA: hypothetical protein PTV74_003224 [Clostridium botulinum]|nr:hypothetical protein [Clostridium botulinum]HDK7206379.1 hypothetical protein [Clostridium botulinum]HDK7210115.1 hypothetical protein [Clostridium botulinum]HDK7265564.1 hypothetical protein [Clostridium botulinum]HDK7269412.1 hypothetical protein [Clostridium botulinum]
MNKKEMYILMRCWELMNGEGFIEYFGDNYGVIEENNFMNWMNEKEYINDEKLKIFKNAKWVTICDCLCGYENSYSLFPYGECDEDANFKSEVIIAEYLLEKGLEDRLIKFAFKGEGWASFDDKEDEISYKNELKEYLNNWNDDDNDGFERINNLSIQEINDKLFKKINNI